MKPIILSLESGVSCGWAKSRRLRGKLQLYISNGHSEGRGAAIGLCIQRDDGGVGSEEVNKVTVSGEGGRFGHDRSKSYYSSVSKGPPVSLHVVIFRSCRVRF